MNKLALLLFLSFATIMGIEASTSWADDAGPPPPETIQVTASGTGRDETGATKDALSNAVRQAIGEFVSSDQMVKNDEVIRDQILTYSDGFVEDYQVVGKPKKDDSGLISLTLQTKVRRSKLVEKLRAANVTTTEVNGKGLFAEVVTKEEQKASAVELAAKEFKNGQAGLIKAIAGHPTYDDQRHLAIVPVTITVDRDAYQAFVTRTERVFDQISVETMSAVAQDSIDGGRIGMVEGHGAALNSVQPNGQNGVVCICERISNDLRTSKWKNYSVSRDAINAMFNSLGPPPTISLELLDDHGNVVDSKDLALNAYTGDTYLGTPINALQWNAVLEVMIAPVLPSLQGTHCGFLGAASPTWHRRFAFALTVDQLRNISSVRCTVNGASNSSN